MEKGTAVKIFEQINSDKYTDQEKLIAISYVLNIETHNGIKKDDIIKAFKWFIDGEESEGKDERK